MEKFHKERRRGFTLVEVLIVVAIIGILLAIAIPNVLDYYRELKITELDDSARTIFLAAQNEITAYKNRGGDLKGIGDVVSSTASGDPADLRYVYNNGTGDEATGLHNVVIGGSVDLELQDHHFIVEFSPDTGAVYAVWYWETDGEMSYSADRANLTDKSKRVNEGKIVGYYGGDKVERIAVGQMPLPTVSLINAEELRLEIKVPADTTSTLDPNKIFVDICINGEKISGADGYNIWNDGLTDSIVLDTLFDETEYPTSPAGSKWTYGKSYKDWRDDFSTLPAPGEDLDITVTLRYNGKVDHDGDATTPEVYLLPQILRVTGNSLFAEVEGGNTAHIAYGRHLQNLDQTVSGLPSGVITGAVQDRNIDFSLTGSPDYNFWGSIYSGRMFDPIENGSLLTYDGNENYIKALNAVKTDGPAGLFGTVANGGLNKIADLTLINAKAKGGNSTDFYAAGSLIGLTNNGITIDNCKVYVDDKDLEDIDYSKTGLKPDAYYVDGASVGGLIGSVNGTGNIVINNSFASTVVKGGNNVGGLVGTSTTGTFEITGSYAAGYLCGYDDFSSAGGLVGSGSASIANSYAAGIIDVEGLASGGSVGGLVGLNGSSVNATGSYAAVRYAGATTSTTIYGTYNGDTNNYYVAQSGVTYVDPSGIKTTTDDLKKLVQTPDTHFSNTTYWNVGTGVTNEITDTHAYNLVKETEKLGEDAYPYPMLKGPSTSTPPMPQYGDWLENDASFGLMAYWEQYNATTYGFYGFDPADGTPGALDQPINTLRNAAPGTYAIDDGYGILVKRDASGNTIMPTGITVGGSPATLSFTQVENAYENAAGEKYDLYIIMDLSSSITTTTNYYTQIDVDGISYAFNPDYACEVFRWSAVTTAPNDPMPKTGAAGSGSGGVSGDFDGEVVIRTARQLANLAANTAGGDTTAQGRTYQQLLDIDYEEYEGTSITGGFNTGKTVSQTPAIFNGGTYYGNEHIIKNLHIGAGTSGTGLFAAVEGGRVEGVRLVNCTVKGGANPTGGLVGVLTGGTVENCGIYLDGINIDDIYSTDATTGNGVIGGLIGQLNGGNVTDSFAAVRVSGSTGTGAVGGFVGSIAGGTVEDCYVGGHTDTGSYTSGTINVTGGGSVGGFVGSYTAGTFAGVNYSTASVQTTGASGTPGLFAGDGTISPSAGTTFYSTGVAFNAAGGSTTTARTESYLLTGSKVPAHDVAVTVTAIPYDNTLGDSYPFRSGTENSDHALEHHGDWVVAPMPAYVEHYTGGAIEYGIYSAQVDDSGNVEILENSLQNDDLTVIDDFYALASTQPISTLTPYDNAHLTITTDKGTYYLYRLDLMGGTAGDYYTSVSYNDSKYIYNPNYACEAFDVTAYTGTAPTDPLKKPEAGKKKGSSDLINVASGEVVIRTARQLANFAANTTTVGTAASQSVARGRTYQQLLDINYSTYTGAGLTVGTGASPNPQTPAVLTADGAYHGNGYSISNLHIGSNTALTGGTGLFATVGGTVDELDLVSCTITGTTTPTGGLVGVLGSDASVENCNIYLETPAGATSIDRTFYMDTRVSGAGVTGGLIGQLNGGTVSKSSASVHVSGTGTTGAVGGFVGAIESGTVSNCQAGGFVETTTTGGVTTTTYSPNSVNVTGSQSVGGFVGSYTAGTFEGVNYSTASVGGPDTARLGLFCGDEGTGITKPTASGDLLYASAMAFEYDAAGNYTVTAARDESNYLGSPSTVTTNTGTDYHYGRAGEVYPYQMTSTGVHHGDWIDLVSPSFFNTFNAGNPIWYINNGGTVHAYNSSGIMVAALSALSGVVTDDGYAFLSTTDLGDDLAIGINGSSFSLVKKAEKVTVGTTEYKYAYQVPKDALNAIQSESYYYIVGVNGQYFTANFAFAGEIYNEVLDAAELNTPKANKTLLDSDGHEVVDADIVITSARQLADLGILTNNDEADEAVKAARASKILQLYDIDFNEYNKGKIGDENKLPDIKDEENKTYNHVPITLQSGASYNGGGHTIRNMRPGAFVDLDDKFALNGMFAKVTGATLEGITLVNARVVTENGNSGVMSTPKETTGTTPPEPTTPTEPKTPNILDVGDLDTGSFWRDICDDPYFELLPKETNTSESNTSSVKDASIEWKSSSGETVYTSTKAINFGGTSSTSKNSIKFTVKTVPATLKVWWGVEKAEDKRQIQIIGPSSSDTQASEIKGLAVGVPYFEVFEITKAGTYYLGCASSANLIYRVEVYEEEVPYRESDPRPYDTENNKYPFPEESKGVAIPSDAKIRAGALAGIVDGAVITDCGVYIEAEPADIETAYNNDYLVRNSFANSNDDCVGGLIGNVVNSKVTDCYAAVKVIGVQVAGGFAGKLGGDDTVVDSCYVGGHTVKGTYIDATGKAVVNISTSAEDKQTFTGGFVGQITDDVKFSGTNYTTASAGNNDYYNNNNGKFSMIGRFAGTIDSNGGKPQEESSMDLYASGDVFHKGKSGYYEILSAGSKVAYEYTENGKSKSKDIQPVQLEDYLDDAALVIVSPTTDASAYDQGFRGDRYPYPTDQGIHYGDWTERYNFIYYEIYDENYTGNHIMDIANLTTREEVENVIGFYAELRDSTKSDGKRLVNTLHIDKIVRDSGYMILTNASVDSVTFTITTKYGHGARSDGGKQMYLGDDKRIDNVTNPLFFDRAGESIADYFYVIPFEEINLAPSDTYYQRVTINGQPYMLNQYFACEAVNVDLAVRNTSGDWEMDYKTVRVKNGLEYIDKSDGTPKTISLDTGKDANGNGRVIIRSPWNLASMVRFTRMGNTSDARDMARTLRYDMLTDVDYELYVKGRIYDGNDHNRTTVGTNKKYDVAGSSYIYGQAPAVLNGGTFDGHGHTLSHLHLSNDTSLNFYVGIFSGLDNKAAVKNLNVEHLGLNASPSVKKYEKTDTSEYQLKERYTYMGGIAAQVMGGSTVENVTLSDVTFDMHAIPTYNDDDDKWEWPDKTKDSALAPIRSVGGAVGLLIDGKVNDVTVNGLNINLEGEEHRYDTNDNNEFDIKEVSSGGTKSYSIVRNDVEINVGGAIGSIETYAYGHAMDTADPNRKGGDTTVASATGTGDGKAEVESVYVTDMTINASKGKGNYVGGVVGKADGKKDGDPFTAADREKVVIRDSGVYLTDPVVTTGGDDRYYTTGIVSKQDKYAGGFVGRSDEYVKIDNSFAAIRVWGQKEVGGFAGHIDGSWIEDCFAGGHTEGGAYTNDKDKANVKSEGSATERYLSDDPSAGKTYPESGTFAGGFAGVIERSDGALRLIGTVYSTASVYSPKIDYEIKTNQKVDDKYYDYYTTKGGYTGVFVGDPTRGDSMEGMLEDVEKDGMTVKLYATGTDVGGGTDAWKEADEYGLLTGLSVPTGKADASHRYDKTLPTDYPYANHTEISFDDDPAKLAHVGDWAASTNATAFYYELEGGKYHFYSLIGDITSGDTEEQRHADADLCVDRDGATISTWGYGYLAPEGVKVTDQSGAEIGTAPTDPALKAALEDEFGAGVMVVDGATTKKDPDTWKFEDASGKSISFYVNTAYAAAIEAAAKDPAGGLVATTLGTPTGKPYQIRTVQQMQNIGDGSDKCFEETHDVVFNDTTASSYTSAANFKGEFNGGSYRIIDITKPVFNELTDGANIHNVIVYAPKGDKTINGQGGIANTVSTSSGSKATISDTIVAGYTIKDASVGGLVGEVKGGTLNITNSEATNDLEGTANVGGLVGSVASGANLTVSNSYAGGSIASGATSAGGLVGAADGTVTYENVYSYVDMTAVNENNQKYGIGPQVDVNAKDTIGYWEGGLTNVNPEDRKLRKGLPTLVDWSEDPKKEAASEHTFIPGTADGFTDQNASNPFPYKAYVTDQNGENIHYGKWPEVSNYIAGFFYWEKEVILDSAGNIIETKPIGISAYGAEMVGGKIHTSELFDTLCYDHHINERASIVESGYGYFYIDNVSVTGNSGNKQTFAEDTAKNEEATTQLLELLDSYAADYDGSKIHVQLSSNQVTEYNKDGWTISIPEAVSGVSGGVKVNVRLYPAFGTGIMSQDYEMGGIASDDDDLTTTPFVARTVRQFSNMCNNTNSDLDSYALTHDIDFRYTEYDSSGVLKSNKDLSIYKPDTMNKFNAKVFNGNGYRIVDFEFEAATGNAALILSPKNLNVLKNVVLYSPKGDAEIATMNGSAAGLVDAKKKLTIENCVVAGYTIKGTDNVGGLIADNSGDNNASITNCQTYVTLDGRNSAKAIGGLVGKAQGSISSSYTGGKVIEAGTSAKVGGIYGTVNNKVTIEDCYTYMDLTAAGASDANLYPIGDNNNATIKDTYYYEENFPAGNSNASQAKKMKISALAVKEGQNAADSSWWPGDTTTVGTDEGLVSNQMGGFPFRAVAFYISDNVKHYVHYGQWPYDAQVMGIAYWEKYTDGEIGLQIVGVDKGGNKLTDADGKIIDTIRKDPPNPTIPTVNEIESSGYVAFSTIYNKSVSMDESAGTEAAPDDTVALIAQALDVKLEGVCRQVSAVITPAGAGGSTANSTTVTVNDTTVTLYYSGGFAGVSYDELGTEAAPFEIRTVAQLDNIPDGSAASFKQTHDIYGEDYDGYTGAENFAGDYDGQGYHILDLDIKGTLTSNYSGIGLFNSTKPANSTTKTIKNVILYSPTGEGKIEVSIKDSTQSTSEPEDEMGVGGIVGYIGGSALYDTISQIQNCVVAGYTIHVTEDSDSVYKTYKVSVGGIVGYSYYGFRIQNCEAVNKINLECEGDGVGGILGAFHSGSVDTTELTGSYAGGSITTKAADVHSGGIFGRDANTGNDSDYKLNLDKCYTYVDLSQVTMPSSGTATCYTLGDKDDMSSNKTNYYLDDSTLYPTDSTFKEGNKNGTPKDYDEMKSVFYDTSTGKYTDGYGEAVYTYIPDKDNPGWAPSADKKYLFPAVVKYEDSDGNEKCVHYGDVPKN